MVTVVTGHGGASAGVTIEIEPWFVTQILDPSKAIPYGLLLGRAATAVIDPAGWLGSSINSVPPATVLVTKTRPMATRIPVTTEGALHVSSTLPSAARTRWTAVPAAQMSAPSLATCAMAGIGVVPSPMS